MIGTTPAWVGLPDKDTMYLNVVPAKNDGLTTYSLSVKDVPVDAFWSISVYNADGYFQANPQNAYNVNSVTAKKDANGSVQVQFGNCAEKTPNCLPIMAGWNYLVRLYLPRAELRNGAWQFPKAQPF